MRTGTATTLVETADPISDPMPRPKRSGMLYRKGSNELWLVNFDGGQNRKLRLAEEQSGSGLMVVRWKNSSVFEFPAQFETIEEYPRVYARDQRRKIHLQYQSVRNLQSQR